jgi:hypothetical protein
MAIDSTNIQKAKSNNSPQPGELAKASAPMSHSTVLVVTF